MASFRTGAKAVVEAASRQGVSAWAPILRFEPGETKYIQFMHTMDEVTTVLMHQYIIVGEREDGSPIYERFISRRDPALDGPKGYDEIWDRFGYAPTERSIAVVLELEPVYGTGKGSRKTIEGFDVVERQYENQEGETVTVPNFVLVIESPRTFFTHLAANADIKEINETIFAVKRTGKGTDTTYTFIDTGYPALDVEELYEEFAQTFDLEAWLTNLADERRMEELIGPLPDDAKIATFPPKGKSFKRDEKKEPRSLRTRRTVAEVEDEDDDVQNDESSEEKVVSRSRRFAELRRQAKSK
jgi:hypothetical protein